MRRFWIVPAVLLLAAYWLWPYAGAYVIAQAAARHDAPCLAAHVNEPALKRSLGRQIVTTYLAKSGRGDRMGAFQRGLANAVGTTLAAPYLEQLLAPDALASLLAEGKIGDIKVGDRTVAINRQVPSLPSLFHSHIFAVLLHSYYDGIASFRFSVPEVSGSENDYGVHLRLSGLTWRLSGLDLPPDVLDRIATDAVAAERSVEKNGG